MSLAPPLESSGGRPRRCLERLRTPFDDHIRGFCRARAPIIALGSPKERPAAVMRKKQACRTNNKACHRRAQLRRKRCCRRDRPMLFSATNYKRPSMLSRSVRQALVNACQGSGPPELFPFFKGYRGAPISLDDVLGNLLGRRQDRFTADHSDTTDEGIRRNE